MNLSWNAVLQGTITGIVGATVFWIIGLLRDAVRNLWLRRSIRRQLRLVSCGHGIQGITTSIHNHLQKPFRVRDVSLVTEKGNYAFNATGMVSSSGLPLPCKLTRDMKRRLKRGEAVKISTQTAHRSVFVNPEHVGFVEVKPFTEQGFVLPLELVADIDQIPKHIQITVEYETWTKKTRVLVQCTESWAVSTMQKVVDAARGDLLSGNLNKARQMFHLPPVPIPPTGAHDASINPSA